MSDRLILDGPAIARALGLHPGTIRNWASAGVLPRRGVDARGRTLYDLDEVQALADGVSDDDVLADSVQLHPAAVAQLCPER